VTYVRLRGTPFITAVVMSAAAMFLIPEDPADRAGRPSEVSGLRAEAEPTASAAQPTASPEPDADAAADPPAQPTPPPVPARAVAGTVRTLRFAEVNLAVNGFWSWSLLDRRTGQLGGSANLASRSDTASMIKVWIAADYLRRATERRQAVEPSRLGSLSIMIRDSNNEIASDYHRANGGSASITRMVAICGLTESRAVAAGSWSTTEVSARDGARLGACVTDGRAAGGQWTGWLLNEMRQVRGGGRFGIISAFAPDVARGVSIKNGWINRRDGKWHIACLAVAPEWSLAVLTVYPVSLGQGYGANICKQVAVQLGVTA